MKVVFKRIFVYLKPYKLQLFIAFIFAVLSVLLGLIGPVVIGSAIDYVIGKGEVNFNMILKYLFYLIITTLLAAVSSWILSFYTKKVAAFVAKDIRQAAFKASNSASLIVLDSHTAGDTVSRMVNDAELVGEGVLQGLTQFLPGIVTIAGTLGVMLWQSPPIAILVVVITPASILLASTLAKRTSNLFKKQAAAQGELSGFISEMVSSSAVVRSFGYQERCFSKFDEINQRLADVAKKSVFYSSVSNPGTRFVNSIVYAAVCVTGAIFAVMGRITIGQLSIFLTYANQYTKPFNEISGVLTQIQTAVAAANRLFVLIDLKPENERDEVKVEITNCNGDVKLKNVEFSYTEKPFIKDLCVEALAGHRIAIVGPTGCGKTTIINLLMRFFEINKGEISVEGINIKKIDRSELRGLYGMVLQDTWLKNATVAENIAYANPSADIEEIKLAAKTAYAHSFIKRLPQGYDTVIASGGINLSAGQRQLICIARIMLAKPQMLILDEATSSIDTRTEMLVQQAFEKLMQGKTSFIVAHRLSTIQSADCILVMKDGEIIEQGTHYQLLQQHGFYEMLYKSQFDAP